MTARPTLSPALVRSLGSRDDVVLPSDAQLALPERAVQFGTGAFLRGFVDSFLDVANRMGVFDGRVVVIGSTGSGRDRALNDQEGLYTLVEQGLVNGAARREFRVVSSVSRALSAATQWDEVLRCAESPLLELIFSNTTEIGIAFDEDDARAGSAAAPPRSFPGKLAAFLVHRARWCEFDTAMAPTVVPCELIEGNGDALRAIVVRLASAWTVEREFHQWLESVPFCNTLVDRIVPGAPGGAQAEEIAAALDYTDGMTTVCEPYRLFAIEASSAVRSRLRFAAADEGIILTDSVTPYRLRKVRLLNGAHTSFVSLAILSGCTTVRESVEHPVIGPFLRRTLLDEIVPSVDVPGAEEFARAVLDRFANPYLQHQLWDITLQGTSKMKVRIVPSILDHTAHFGEPPRALALGFAGFLALQRGELQAARRAQGLSVPADASGAALTERWSGIDDSRTSLASMVDGTLSDVQLWGADLTAVAGFPELVTDFLRQLRTEGPLAAMQAC